MIETKRYEPSKKGSEEQVKFSSLKNIISKPIKNIINAKGSENINPDELDSLSIHSFAGPNNVTNVKFPRMEGPASKNESTVKRSETLNNYKKRKCAFDLNGITEEAEIKVNHVLRFPTKQSTEFKYKRRFRK